MALRLDMAAFVRRSPGRPPKHRLALAMSLLAMTVLAACSSRMPSAGPPAAGDVALQPGDLPGSLHRCAQSGDVTQYLENLRHGLPDQYTAESDQWNTLKAQGGVDAWINVYADNQSECDTMFGTGRSAVPGGARVAQSFVFKFKDRGSAERAFKNGILGASTASLGGIPGLKRGSATGLGANSLSAAGTTPGRETYLAFWQKDVFDNLLETINVPEADASRAAHQVDARI